MIVAFTGHRPDKLGGYANEHTRIPLQDELQCRISDKLLDLDPEYVITGMALGVDQMAAISAIGIGIPFIAAVPFEGQESKWPSASQKKYRELIDKAERVVVVCEGGYAAWKMQRRNEWMVDNCDVLIAVWDGTEGGTANCYRYAEKKGRLIVRINPRDLL